VKNILIGSNGGLTGIYLAKYFRATTSHQIFGADASSVSAGRFFVHRQCIIPSAGDEGYIENLVATLNSKHIDYYFPTHSHEIHQVSKNSDFLSSQTNSKFLVCPYETFQSLEDKRVAAVNLVSKGIASPNLIESPPVAFPVIMKNCVGSGGSGALVIDSQEAFDAFSSKRADVAFFEFIKGDEFTVDCLFDSEGRLVGYHNRRRVKTLGGAVVITESANEVPIGAVIAKLSSIWCFRGCVNFQFIAREDQFYLIDINLRFPSGGLPLTVETGLDIPRLMIDIMDGREVATVHAPSQRKRMYRYFEEIYENF